MLPNWYSNILLISMLLLGMNGWMEWRSNGTKVVKEWELHTCLLHQKAAWNEWPKLPGALWIIPKEMRGHATHVKNMTYVSETRNRMDMTQKVARQWRAARSSAWCCSPSVLKMSYNVWEDEKVDKRYLRYWSRSCCFTASTTRTHQWLESSLQ